MSAPRIFAVIGLTMALALGACTDSADSGFQGWVEADLIFVGPDEAGRVETLSVREGDTVERGAPLFSVDPALQQSDVEMAKASVTNARLAFERAQALLKSAAGTQKAVDDAQAALRTAEAQLSSARTRLARRKLSSPISGTVQQVYYRPGELVPAGRPVLALLPPGNIKVRFFVPEAMLPKIKLGAPVTIHCDGCKSDLPAAGDLQPAGARQAGLPGRGAHRHAERPARRPAGRRAICGGQEVSNAADIVIDVHGLTKRFDGRAVVSNLSMQVKRGTIYGFLGPNGSGKTTTIRMLCGLLTPDEGTGTCLGFDIRTEAEKIKRQVGYMTQRFSLYDDLSVRENLEFVARIYGMPNPRKAAQAMIEHLGLTGRERQIAAFLSGGWKQRLSLGACILPNPQLLLLDEPTAGVDPKARRDFWNEIHALAAEGLTALVSTHYMDEAERCHEIAYIAFGHLLTHGTVDQVIGAAHLTTYAVSGDGLTQLAAELATKPGVDSVAPFGTSLHVSGRDHEALEAAIAPHRGDPKLTWTTIESSLEDVFISLMSSARDNMQ
jgi:ABC-2 type transport system ATP-binding protein